MAIDEAQKLRNAHCPSNKVAQGLRWATEGCRKLLLTAALLQNSFLELFGLSTLIDEHIFGDVNAFRRRAGAAALESPSKLAKHASFTYARVDMPTLGGRVGAAAFALLHRARRLRLLARQKAETSSLEG